MPSNEPLSKVISSLYSLAGLTFLPEATDSGSFPRGDW